MEHDECNTAQLTLYVRPARQPATGCAYIDAPVAGQDKAA